jgi:hypothetical protein
MSPAMAAGLSKTLWDVADIVKLVQNCEAENDGKRRDEPMGHPL